MRSLDSIIHQLLFWGFPNGVAVMIWGHFQAEAEVRALSSPLWLPLWHAMSWGLVLWFGVLFVFMLLLVFRKETQEATIRRVAGITERDEREEWITGMAARRSFVSSASFLIFLLFFSCLQLKWAKNPDQSLSPAKSALTIGFGMGSTEPGQTQLGDGTVIHEYSGIPGSKSSLILLVLVWQVVAFRTSIRKFGPGV